MEYSFVSSPAAAPAPVAAPPAAARVAAYTPGRVAPPQKSTRPSDDALIGALALHYRADEALVIEWLRAMDLDAAERRITQLDDAPF